MFARLRAAWRAFWNSTTAAQPAEDAPRRVYRHTAWENDRFGTPTFLPETLFARPVPMPGVLPDGMAMDSLPALPPIAASAYASVLSEGLGFLGFPYLSELSQRAEYRNIVTIWAEHCTRKWIKLTGDDTKVKAIWAEFKRLDVKEMFGQLITKEGFFGRAHLFMDFGDFDKPAELPIPLILDKPKINKRRPLKRLQVVEPMWAYPGPYDAQNPLAPDFYRPSSWYLNGKEVHASRLLTVVGNEMPTMLKPAYAFGGVSRTQLCKAYVDNWLANRQTAADLLKSFVTPVLKTDMDLRLQDDPTGKSLIGRAAEFIKFRDNRGLLMLDKNSEDFENVAAPLSGVPDLVAQSLEQLSTVSGIPISILLGQTPSGLNASSEGEIRIFYDRVMAWMDRHIRPLLDTLLDVVQLSLFEEIDEEIAFEFVPLWEMSDKDKADIRKADADADAVYIASGVISPEEARERLNGEEGGPYHGQLEGPAPIPDDGEDPDELEEAA